MREPKIIENAVESVQVMGHVFLSWIDFFTSKSKNQLEKQDEHKNSKKISTQ